MDTFKTLSGAAKAAGAQTWLPELVEANILKPPDVMARIEPDPALQMPAARGTPCGTNCRSGKLRGGDWLSRREGTQSRGPDHTSDEILAGPGDSLQHLTALLRDIHGPLQGGQPTTTNGVGGGLLTYGDSHST